jgi:hypothetical protein
VSVPDTPGPPDPVPLREYDSGAVVMIVAGVFLLLPGACALFSAFNMIGFLWGDPSTLPLLVILWAVCLAIGYGGLRLIRRGSRSLNRSENAGP